MEFISEGLSRKLGSPWAQDDDERCYRGLVFFTAGPW